MCRKKELWWFCINSLIMYEVMECKGADKLADNFPLFFIPSHRLLM